MADHFGDKLVKKIRNTKSFLCLGVDPHLDLIPNIFDIQNNSSNIITKVEKFCFSLLDSAKDLVPAIKPQIALFEQLGPDGMKLLASLCKYAQSMNFLIIMDAKRGDIGSTSQAYANAYLGKNAPYPSDAMTINPWLGIDSLEPFFKKASETTSGLFVLVHTSNKGSKDIQEMPLTNGAKCYEHLAKLLRPIIENQKGDLGLSSIGIVSGATFKDESLALRKLLPSAPFLIPGYGAQGASAKDACAPLIEDSAFPNLLNFGLINASRSILFPEEAYLAKNIEEWKKIILNKINSTNNELININK
ncbi:orotidine-5'-phosphate decarboxylase [Alphaproteobacteria bacterium]|nr:orotidine-5'-phosphate decarboxylase [Alphaproteobacteria bacterium]